MNLQSFCHLCAPHSFLHTHMQCALLEKHCTSIHFYYLQQIQTIVHPEYNPLTIQFRQIQYQTEDSEFLKRSYGSHQFESKIGQLADYYKFSRDIPKCLPSNLTRTIERYHDRLREFDFKKVKAAIKRQQGISLSSYRQSSSLPDSNTQVKSKYSFVLGGLEEETTNQESHLLNQICQQINDALPAASGLSTFKGNFPSATKKFQEFMEKQERKIKEFCFSKKQRHFRKDHRLANKENNYKNGQNLMRDRSKKSVSKNCNQKTRANDTLSRQQKLKKTDKFLLKTIDCDNGFRPLSTMINLTKHQHQPRTLDQIYKAKLQTYNSSKQKKPSIDWKRKKLPSINQPTKPKLFPRATLLPTRQQQFVLDTDRHPRQQSKKSITNSSVHRSIEQTKRQPSLHSHKALPLAPNQTSKFQRTLSRSKSKSRLSKQTSRQSVKLKPPILHSSSKLSETVGRATRSRSKQDRLRVDKLLNKKLALFINN